MSTMLKHWCTSVMRSKVEPMKDVAKLVRSHFDGILAWPQSRQTNSFLEAFNLFQAAKRKARAHAASSKASRALPHRRNARLLNAHPKAV